MLGNRRRVQTKSLHQKTIKHPQFSSLCPLKIGVPGGGGNQLAVKYKVSSGKSNLGASDYIRSGLLTITRTNLHSPTGFASTRLMFIDKPDTHVPTCPHDLVNVY